MSDVRFPHIRVRLSGQDGNAFFILGRVMEAMRRAGVEKEVREEYRAAATAGDYDHLLMVTMQWVDTY